MIPTNWLLLSWLKILNFKCPAADWVSESRDFDWNILHTMPSLTEETSNKYYAQFEQRRLTGAFMWTHGQTSSGLGFWVTCCHQCCSKFAWEIFGHIVSVFSLFLLLSIEGKKMFSAPQCVWCRHSMYCTYVTSTWAWEWNKDLIWIVSFWNISGRL